MINKEVKFLLGHSSIYGLGTIISRVVTFLLLPLYTRYLTPEDYGILEIIDITSVLIGIVVSIGIANGLSRFYYESDNTDDRNIVVSTTYYIGTIIVLVSTPILYFLTSPISELLFGSIQYAYFFIISFASFLLGIYLDTGILYLRLIKKPAIFISITISRLVFLIFFNILFIVKYEMGIIGILYSSLLVRSVYALFLSIAVLWKTGIKFSFQLAIDMIKYSLPIIPSNLASTLIKQSDKYFVAHFFTMFDTGIYTLALRLGNTVHNLLTIPFNMAYIPRRFEIMKREDTSGTYAKIFTYHMFLVGFVGLLISILIPEILRLMVTPKFYDAASYVPLVVFSMIIFGTHRHFDFGILYSKKTKYLAYINLSTAIINLSLNYILIRSYGLWGAIWSAVLVLSLQAFLMLYVSNKFFRINFEFFRVSKYFILGILFYFISTQIEFKSTITNISLKIILIILFPIIAGLLRIISQSELSKIKEIYEYHIKKILIRIFKLKNSKV